MSDTSHAVAGRDRGRVFKNTVLLVGAQVLTTPLAVLVSALMARHIGAAEYGRLYLVSTFCTFGFLAVDWGQSLTLPKLIATDRSRAGALLASALLWRLVTSLLVFAALAGIAGVLGYGWSYQVILTCYVLGLLVSTLSSACQETIRGFERTDLMAYSQVGNQVLVAIATSVTLLSGGRLRAVLLVQAACNVLTLAAVARAVRRAGVRLSAPEPSTVRTLARDGAPLVLLGLAMATQPNVDALFLSKLVPAEVIGWHAVARRLVGFLVFPASAILTALYPTLCRLFAEDRERYVEMARDALSATTALAVPVALGCLLYPDVGIGIFSKQVFAPAEENLQVMSLFLFLLYISMPLGCVLLAAGRQRAWAIAQALCVGISLLFNPLLIPWFQEHRGNGGLGVCVAGVVSEIFMVGIGIALAPRGLFDRKLQKQIGLALLAGGAMALVARSLAFLTPYVAAPIAVAVYFGCAVALGGIDRRHLTSLRDAVARKLKRA